MVSDTSGWDGDVAELTILWPSGATEKLGSLAADIWSSFREGTVILRKQGFGGSTAKE
jgi:hypothetical protein